MKKKKTKRVRESLDRKLDEFLTRYSEQQTFYVVWACMAVVENKFEEGEIGKELIVWEDKLSGPYKSVKDLISHFSDVVGCPKEDWAIDGENDGIIRIEWVVNRENNPATERELELWRKGFSLWIARLETKIVIVKQRPPTPKELAVLTGMEIA